MTFFITKKKKKKSKKEEKKERKAVGQCKVGIFFSMPKY